MDKLTIIGLEGGTSGVTVEAQFNPKEIPAFEAVIESVNVKYTMFDGNGIPVRAMVSMRFVEARKIRIAKPQ